MYELIYTLISVIIISLVSFTGIVLFSLKKNFLEKILMVLVAFAAGTMLGTAFFHLIPETFEQLSTLVPVLGGMIFFFVLESVIHWHHHHNIKCETCVSPVVYLNLIGDGFHNFLDGVIVAASFIVDFTTGVAVSSSIILHEVPQEIGDFAVLVQGGLSRNKALFFNFISASVAILGGFLGYFFLTNIEWSLPYVVGIAAGSFLYIAGSDLFPTLHKEVDWERKLLQVVFIILGILFMWFVLQSH